MGVEELVPQGVTVQNGAFQMGLDPASVSASLDELCGSCGPLDGTFVSSMPPFTGQIETTQGLPAGIEGGTVSGGSASLSIRNDLSFDPIEGGGTVTLTVSDVSSGFDLTSVVLDGTTESLAPGSTVSRTVALDPTSIGSTLRIRAEIVSVGGQSATIDLTNRITVTLSSTTLLLSDVTFDVGTKSVELASAQLDVGEFDPTLTDRIQNGAIVLTAENPFAVSVDGTLTVGPTTKAFSVTPDGPSTVTLDYTGDELRSFLGTPDVALTGVGTATGGIITVSPDQQILIEGDLDVTLEIGGEADTALLNQ